MTKLLMLTFIATLTETVANCQKMNKQYSTACC